MKKRILLGALIAIVSSVLFSGTALAQVPNVVYSRGDSDPRALTITEWNILPDGSVHCSGGTSAPNGFSAGIIKVGSNGEPVVATFDKEDDYAAFLTASGVEQVPSLEKTTADQRQLLSDGDGHLVIWGMILNAFDEYVNKSQFETNYSWSGSLVTYYYKNPNYTSSDTATFRGWNILSGPNYTPPSLPSTNALGTYNTSFTGPGGAYNWLSLRNRAYAGWGSLGFQYTLAPGCYFTCTTGNGPGWW